MAYLRSEKEIVEVDYPINTVWDAIGKALKGLEWKIEEVNEEKHQMKVKTKANSWLTPQHDNRCAANKEKLVE
jgi:uncharacterized lipoprotein